MEDPEQTRWDAVWDALLAYQDDLRRVAHLWRTGSSLRNEDTDDLVHSFALEHLPEIVRRTADLPEARRRSYVRAALRNFLRTASRNASRERRTLELFAQESPSATRPQELATDIPTLGEFEKGIEGIREPYATAVRLYLSQTPAPSLRRVARDLGCSRYRAQQLIIDGLLALSALLGSTGVLTSEEFKVSSQLLLRGEELIDVASTLGMTEHQVRQTLKSAQDKIYSILH